MNKRIKTKKNRVARKNQVRTANSPTAMRQMQQELIKSKDKLKNRADDGQVTPEEYARDQIRYGAEDVAGSMVQEGRSGLRKAKEDAKKKVRERRNRKAEIDRGVQEGVADIVTVDAPSGITEENPVQAVSRGEVLKKDIPGEKAPLYSPPKENNHPMINHAAEKRALFTTLKNTIK